MVYSSIEGPESSCCLSLLFIPASDELIVLSIFSRLLLIDDSLLHLVVGDILPHN